MFRHIADRELVHWLHELAHEVVERDIGRGSASPVGGR